MVIYGDKEWVFINDVKEELDISIETLFQYANKSKINIYNYDTQSLIPSNIFIKNNYITNSSAKDITAITYDDNQISINNLYITIRDYTKLLIEYNANIGDTSKQKKIPSAVFTSSNDYRHVKIYNKDFNLTTDQAKIIEVLHKEVVSGNTNFSSIAYVCEKAKVERSLNEIFRIKNDEYKKSRDALIETIEDKNLIRLKIFQ